jgi:hypothetical protein
MALTPDVAEAIEEIRSSFGFAHLDVREDSEGGAFVFVNPVDPGPRFTQRETWIGFRITFQYPYSDVYPHFVRGDLARADGEALGEGFAATTFENRPAVQISRRSNHLNPEVDTAAIKLWKVLAWLQSG